MGNSRLVADLGLYTFSIIHWGGGEGGWGEEGGGDIGEGGSGGGRGGDISRLLPFIQVFATLKIREGG